MLNVARLGARLLALAAFAPLLTLNLNASPTFSAAQVFAMGSAQLGNSPDSIFYGGVRYGSPSRTAQIRQARSAQARLYAIRRPP